MTKILAGITPTRGLSAIMIKKFCRFANKKRNLANAPGAFVRTSKYPYIIYTLR